MKPNDLIAECQEVNFMIHDLDPTAAAKAVVEMGWEKCQGFTWHFSVHTDEYEGETSEDGVDHWRITFIEGLTNLVGFEEEYGMDAEKPTILGNAKQIPPGLIFMHFNSDGLLKVMVVEHRLTATLVEFYVSGYGATLMEI